VLQCASKGPPALASQLQAQLALLCIHTIPLLLPLRCQRVQCCLVVPQRCQQALHWPRQVCRAACACMHHLEVALLLI
jgi:hypothetical protein